MKQAREEAEAEIAAFRAQKEINFQKQQAAVNICTLFLLNIMIIDRSLSTRMPVIQMAWPRASRKKPMKEYSSLRSALRTIAKRFPLLHTHFS